ncbi:hypothetical protein MYCTH_2124533 [Thermothelomyces thermophilus ATCC 42464]|uniref:Uncharacterized protein n=1 Tax=Thermothelomyces thermophilus (strain ATCC 42464 / BCRC 31852 / DSM 1799) TaxID=573729 RepID=G2Q6L3_THET4|nr:uncharacterized protein MYCTH_2124533 [Thermothelomyces thermophilus ATCC 42464]AEO55586.1 hypothetical protein MYCTH_2124533 [Thermothelomyces thermophilus ATCC 42464]
MTDQDSGLRHSRFQAIVTELDLSLGLALIFDGRLPSSLSQPNPSRQYKPRPDPDSDLAPTLHLFVDTTRTEAWQQEREQAEAHPYGAHGCRSTINAHQVQEKRTIEASSPPAYPQKTVNEEKTGSVVLPVVYHVAAAPERAKAAQDAWVELSTGKSV